MTSGGSSVPKATRSWVTSAVAPQINDRQAALPFRKPAGGTVLAQGLEQSLAGAGGNI